MRNVPVWKIVFVAILLVTCLITSAPTLRIAGAFAPLIEVFGGNATKYAENWVTLGLDLQGGIDLVYLVDSKKPDDMVKAIEVLNNRLDQLGLVNMSIQRQGEKQIRIQIPGIEPKKQRQIKKIINTVDMLRFQQVMGESPSMFGLSPGKDETIVQGVQDPKKPDKAPSWYLVKKVPEITGDALSKARIAFDAVQGKPKIELEFTKAGTPLFTEITERLLNKPLAIVLAGKVYMAPVIRAVIRDGHAEITGTFDIEEAKLVTSILKAGALPCELKKLAEMSVGPTLGKESIRRGVWAAGFGMLLVLVFMIIWYKLAGFFADLAMVFNLLIIITLLWFFGATLTLPGIAGLILTIGMSVDANVIIFERIKEELRAGKTVRASIDAGFSKAFTTILDANLTTFFTALVLWFFGTGAVKGFAVTLSFGLAASLFTSLVVVRMILDMVYAHKSTGSISI